MRLRSGMNGDWGEVTCHDSRQSRKQVWQRSRLEVAETVVLEGGRDDWTGWPGDRVRNSSHGGLLDSLAEVAKE